MTQATNQAGEHAGSKPSSGGGEEDMSHTLRMFATLFPSLNKCQGPNWCHKGIHTYGMETVHPSFTLPMTTVSACPLLPAQVAGRGKGDGDRQLARASCSHYSLALMKLHQAGNSVAYRVSMWPTAYACIEREPIPEGCCGQRVATCPRHPQRRAALQPAANTWPPQPDQ